MKWFPVCSPRRKPKLCYDAWMEMSACSTLNNSRSIDPSDCDGDEAQRAKAALRERRKYQIFYSPSDGRSESEHIIIIIKRMLFDAIEQISSTWTAFNSQYPARARTNDDDDDRAPTRVARAAGRGTSADREPLAHQQLLTRG